MDFFLNLLSSLLQENDSSDLLSMYVSIPSLNNQQTIVNIINNIDNKISNEKELLKLYRAQKVYLLKNMFI